MLKHSNTNWQKNKEITQVAYVRKSNRDFAVRQGILSLEDPRLNTSTLNIKGANEMRLVDIILRAQTFDEPPLTQDLVACPPDLAFLDIEDFQSDLIPGLHGSFAFVFQVTIGWKTEIKTFRRLKQHLKLRKNW